MTINRRDFNRYFGATALGGTMLGGFNPALAQEITRWGTSTLGAGSQVTLAAIIATVDEANPELGVQEQITGGPVENVRLLSQDLIEIAQTTTNVAFNAHHGRGDFEGNAVPLLGLFAIYPANCTLAVALDSDIHSIDDMRGKRIAIGPPAAGITVIMEAWLEAYGIADDATLVRIGYTDGVDQLRSGGVDAALVFGVGGSAVGYLQELDLSMDVRILGWDVRSPEYETLQDRAPEMATYGIFSKDLASNLDEDLTVPTTYSAEYSSTSYPEEFGYRLVKTVWENREAIKDRANLGSWLAQQPGNMLAGLSPDIPVHPGAARFYKELGVWDDGYTIGEVR